MGGVVMELTETMTIRGHLTLTVLGADGAVQDTRCGENVMCTTGYSALAAALVWAGMQDQAANLGVTTATDLTPLWGAIGSGTGIPAKADTALFFELARQTVGAGASTPATSSVAAQATWLFYFAPPSSTWTVTEAGVFAGGTSTAGTGSMVDHWAFSPSVSVSTSNSLILEVSLALGP